jgi:hypothetical protein
MPHLQQGSNGVDVVLGFELEFGFVLFDFML